MKEYLLLFRNISGDNTYITTTEDMMEDMPKWQAWIGNIAGQGKLISTQPIAYNGITVNHAETKHTPHITEAQLVAGYLICKAESEAEVIAWANTCPILKYANGSVEIRPVIPFTA